jgi:hypothetical protein
MPRYFFHIHHERPSYDQQGEEFADRQAAWHDAVVSISHGSWRQVPTRTDLEAEVADEFEDNIHVRTEGKP